MIINRIKVLKKKKNWTQQELAKKLNITRQSVAAIENGKYSLSLSLAFKIARVFEVDLSEVFKDEEEVNK